MLTTKAAYYSKTSNTEGESKYTKLNKADEVFGSFW
jgi:hypothetical protein